MAHTNVNQEDATFTYVKTIADRTKQAREALGLNQVQLAEAAGVAAGTIGNIEAGTRKNPRELLAIAAALHVNPEWLKSGKGVREAGLQVAEPPAPYSEQLSLSPAERDLILALRKLPDEEQVEFNRDVMHRAENIDQVVRRELAKHGIEINDYVSASRAAETLPAPPAAGPANERQIPSPIVMTGRAPQQVGREDDEPAKPGEDKK